LHRPFGAWTGAAGVQLSDRAFAAVGDEAFVLPVDTTAYGVFVVEQLDLPSWQLSLGARMEVQEHRPANGLEPLDGNAASLSFAAVRDFGDGYSLALNAARAERLPMPEELFSSGPHLATRAVQIGNPALTEETSRHFDVGLRRTSDAGVAWNVTAFVTRYDDFIFLQDTGFVAAGEELPVFAFAQQNAEFTGLETELFLPIAAVAAGEVDMRLFADYVRGELDDGDDLPRLPPLRYGARFQYHDERLTVGLEATQYDDQRRVARFEEPTEGYTMINADFVWRIETSGGMQLDFFTNGSNLADEEARKHTSFVKDVAPLPGRNFSVGVRSRF
jgi:iron complex outermembrane receptor protein